MDVFFVLVIKHLFGCDVSETVYLQFGYCVFRDLYLGGR